MVDGSQLRVVASGQGFGDLNLRVYEPDGDAIVEHLVPLAEEGDVVVVLSNGGFGGIHEKLLEKLGNVKP